MLADDSVTALPHGSTRVEPRTISVGNIPPVIMAAAFAVVKLVYPLFPCENPARAFVISCVRLVATTPALWV
ncbi:hypothetical protein D3C87_2043960 [compost metagenome]